MAHRSNPESNRRYRDDGRGSYSYQRGGRREYDRLNYDERSRARSSRSDSRSRSRSRSRSPRHRRQSPRYGSPDRDGRYYESDDSRDHDRHRRGERRSQSPLNRPDMLGVPSTDVMMQGLDPQISEADLMATLASLDAKVDKVIIIRDRQTKVSRGFGFARFVELADACAFVEDNYPYITCKNSRIRILYSRESKQTDDADGWICRFCDVVNFARRTECYKCFAPRKEAIGGTAPAPGTLKKSAGPPKANDGSGDVGEVASQFLMLRGLEPSSTEEVVAKAMSDLDLKSFRRVLMVRDKATKLSLGFAFVEYSSVADCTTVLEYLNKHYPGESDDDAFVIDGVDVMPSFIHSGVFIPSYASDADDKYTFLAANGSTRLSYWDDNAYVGVYVDPSSQRDDVSAFFTDMEASTGMKPTEPEPLASTKQEDKPKKRKIETVTAPKKMAPQLQKWQKKQAELHGSSKQDKENKTASAASTFQESYSDPRRPACLLCRRKFKAFDEVNRHERLSALHRHNEGDAELCEKARDKVKRAKDKAEAQKAADSAYRDRARERRIAQNQPARPPRPVSDKHHDAGRNVSSAPTAKDTAPEEESDDDMFSTSKGSKLLEKMGWKSGSGLGASGTGIAEAIKPELYAQGVGLGAEGAKLDAEKEGRPSTYGDFVERVREKARERFNNA